MLTSPPRRLIAVVHYQYRWRVYSRCRSSSSGTAVGPAAHRCGRCRAGPPAVFFGEPNRTMLIQALHRPYAPPPPRRGLRLPLRAAGMAHLFADLVDSFMGSSPRAVAMPLRPRIIASDAGRGSQRRWHRHDEEITARVTGPLRATNCSVARELNSRGGRFIHEGPP